QQWCLQARAASRSCAFSTSAIARKDLVQELYLKELKAYKPAPAAKDAHLGAVKAYSLPPVPKPPTLPADLAAELSAYDAVEPVSAAAKDPVTSTEHVSTGADTFLAFLEADEPQEEKHH
ncbi:ATP synthase complex subunit H-domain-containing protein, partial [Sparassis latifolia]